MKLLKEDAYTILLNKYNINQVTLKDNGIVITARDKSYKDLHVPPLPNKNKFISKNQIARYGNYLYIPADQFNDLDRNFEYEEPLSSRSLNKKHWLNIKTKHPYYK